MAELEDDLKATAGDIAAEAEDLQAIEERKARLEPDDPEVRELAREGERIARRIVPKTTVERELADEAADEAAGKRRAAN